MRARRSLGVFRVLIAAIEVVAIIGNFEYVLGFRFFATANFFSYFTVQAAMLAVVTLAIAAAYALLAPNDPPWLGILRTMVTVYLLVSGLVFALIVSQASSRDYRVDVPWSDTLLHFVVPALAVIAWTADSIMAVNPPVPWSTVAGCSCTPRCGCRTRSCAAPTSDGIRTSSSTRRRSAGARGGRVLRARARDLRGDHGAAGRRQPGAVA
jgi:hypothetical protein